MILPKMMKHKNIYFELPPLNYIIKSFIFLSLKINYVVHCIFARCTYRYFLHVLYDKYVIDVFLSGPRPPLFDHSWVIKVWRGADQTYSTFVLTYYSMQSNDYIPVWVCLSIRRKCIARILLMVSKSRGEVRSSVMLF